ncbi:MAG: non-homologous end-joining DNA ligase [Gammaproteobacteria bacterium]
MPDRPRAMLATLTHDYFSSPDWIYERKLDGERCLVVARSGRVTLRSRSGQDTTSTWPEIAEALETLEDRGFVADGEIVAFEGRVTSFSRLQQRIGLTDPDKARASGVRVYLYLFDLLFLEGYDLREVPLRARKKILKNALTFDDPVRYTTHRNRDGEAYHREACRKGWEGVIAKRADSPYRARRSRDWLKFKCSKGQELVIGGFTEPSGERVGLGAIFVGYYDDDKFCYAGKVGTGFDDDTLRTLRERLEKLERDRPAFEAVPGSVGDGAHWVEPRLVAEIAFTEWTRAGRLRHPRFQGLRRDKKARDVVRERPKPVSP